MAGTPKIPSVTINNIESTERTPGNAKGRVTVLIV